jgi:hypothetical protein
MNNGTIDGRMKLSAVAISMGTCDVMILSPTTNGRYNIYLYIKDGPK